MRSEEEGSIRHTWHKHAFTLFVPSLHQLVSAHTHMHNDRKSQSTCCKFTPVSDMRSANHRGGNLSVIRTYHLLAFVCSTHAHPSHFPALNFTAECNFPSSHKCVVANSLSKRLKSRRLEIVCRCTGRFFIVHHLFFTKTFKKMRLK